MGKTAILFPGQGAQTVGMGRDVVERSPAAQRVFQDAGRILGFDLADVCFNGPADRLNATDISQPAIFATSVALWQALLESPVAAHVQPSAAAGLSLGEYTALWLARSIGFEDGLRLVSARGRFMQQAAEARAGGMVTVIGLDPAKVQDVVREAAQSEVLAPANFNSSGQIVISGDQGACRRSEAVIERLGGRAVPLKVAGAFHSPLMCPAAENLRPLLEKAPLGRPEIPVVSNVTADYHQDPAAIRALLYSQVAEPIRWQMSIERLVRDGYDRFIEVGPGRVLTGLMRSINRGVRALNVSTAASMDNLAAAPAAETVG